MKKKKKHVEIYKVHPVFGLFRPYLEVVGKVDLKRISEYNAFYFYETDAAEWGVMKKDNHKYELIMQISLVVLNSGIKDFQKNKIFMKKLRDLKDGQYLIDFSDSQHPKIIFDFQEEYQRPPNGWKTIPPLPLKKTKNSILGVPFPLRREKNQLHNKVFQYNSDAITAISFAMRILKFKFLPPTEEAKAGSPLGTRVLLEATLSKYYPKGTVKKILSNTSTLASDLSLSSKLGIRLVQVKALLKKVHPEKKSYPLVTTNTGKNSDVMETFHLTSLIENPKIIEEAKKGAWAEVVMDIPITIPNVSFLGIVNGQLKVGSNETDSQKRNAQIDYFAEILNLSTDSIRLLLVGGG